MKNQNIKYYDPNLRDEKVYECYLNITNPLVTSEIDNGFISDLKEFIANADMSLYENETANTDMWDKRNRDIDYWLEKFQDDVDNGSTYAWTSIPDVVTDFLKSKGYDGIIDAGGKSGGEIHTVAIPFYSNQIKSIDNKNPTLGNPDIRYSLKGDFSKATLENNIQSVSNMNPVSFMLGNEFEKGEVDLITQVERYFNSHNYIVHTNYGSIIINRKGIKDSLGHGIGRDKAIAFKAVPDVLKMVW